MNISVPATLEPVIKKALFQASYTTMWTSELIKLDYQKECERRAKAPSGELKGKIISKLSDKDRSLLPPLIVLTKSSNELVRKAAKIKISQIKFFKIGRK